MTEYDEQLRIIVVGTRTWTEQGTILQKMMAAVKGHFFGAVEPSRGELEAVFPNVTIVHGGAKGADSFAHQFAKEYGMQTEVFKAQWDELGQSAGPIRNKKMVLSSPRADLVLAFVSDSDSKGTNSTISLARKNNIPVAVVESVRQYD